MTDGARPFVSVIVPCRNEARYIDACLRSISGNDYPGDRLEVLVMDGVSDDGTDGIVAQWMQRDRRVRLIPNDKRSTPAALNLGLEHANGDVIVRMDAHCRYPTNYITVLVASLFRSGADNVGGVCRTVPAGEGTKARAIAVALSHPFGVGNAAFRIGAAAPRYVDTVPFGCYRREVFSRIGRFDEQLVRNQDDEFNHRLIRRGGRILLVPDVQVEYIARDSLTALRRMYYEYGYYKPLSEKKAGGVRTLRQLAPPTFVLAVTAASAGAVVGAGTGPIATATVGAYGVALLAAAAGIASSHGWRVAAWMLAAFPIMHWSYGAGYLRALAELAVGRHRPMQACRVAQS